MSFAEEEISVEGIEVPVLMYHHISDDITSQAVVTAEKFEEDLITLISAGYETIFLDELASYLQGQGTLPEKPILITFDDGYYSNYEFAYPLAKKYDIKITISVIGWSVGRDSFIYKDASIIPHFNYEEAKEMLESGHVDLQNHTYDLHNQKGLSLGGNRKVNTGVLPLPKESLSRYKSRISLDLLKYSFEMYAQLNRVPKFLFYPYGVYGDAIESFIYDMGFQGSFLTLEGVRKFESMEDLKKVPRLNVDNHLRGDELLQAIEKLEKK